MILRGYIHFWHIFKQELYSFECNDSQFKYDNISEKFRKKRQTIFIFKQESYNFEYNDRFDSQFKYVSEKFRKKREAIFIFKQESYSFECNDRFDSLNNKF